MSGVNFYKISLAVLISLSLLLRLVDLDRNPPGLYVDDAAIGYNAYSLSQTGRDEYGQAFPIFLKSFGSFTPALAVYFAVLPIKIFGLETWALRLTPALLGVATVIVFAVFCARIIPTRPKFAFLFGGLLLSICPQLILFNRGFYESPLSLLLFLIGLVYFLRFRILPGLLFFSLSAYAYHSQRLIIYLFLFGFGLLFRRKILALGSKKLIICLVIFLLTQLPQFYLSTSAGPSKRFLNRTWLPEISARSSSLVDFAGGSLREFSSQYLTYYNPRNVFWLPDPDQQRSLPELSIYYPWLVIPYLIGLIYLIKHHRNYPALLLLMGIAPVSAALTKDPFSVLRASLIILPITVIILIGLQKFNRYLIGVLLIFSLFSLYRSLFVLLPQERYMFWTYGYDQAFHQASKIDLPLLVDAEKPVYTLYLFYSQVSPRLVWQLAPSTSGYYTQTQWTDYYSNPSVRFARLDWRNDIYIPQLILSGPLSISPHQATEHFLTHEFTVYSPGGQDPVLIAYRTHPDLKCKSDPLANPVCKLILTP